MKKAAASDKAKARFDLDPAIEMKIRQAAQTADQADDEQARMARENQEITRRLRVVIEEVLFRTSNPNLTLKELWSDYLNSGVKDGEVNRLRKEWETVQVSWDAASDRKREANAELEKLIVPLGRAFNEATSAAYDTIVAEVALSIRPFCVSDDEAAELAPIFRRCQIASEVIGEWGRGGSWASKGRCLVNDIRRFNEL